MSRIRPFHPGDFDGLAVHPAQFGDCYGPDEMRAAAETLARGGRAFTLRNAEGAVTMIGIMVGIDPGYAHCIAYMSREAGPQMAWLTRKVRRYIDAQMTTHRRIEMMVRADFAPGLRWAALLGFHAEGVVECAAPDGGDMVRFARINRIAAIRRRAA